MKSYNLRGITSLLGAGVAVGGFVGMALLAQAATYDVNVDPFTLYTDPCNGLQIKVGGFSGLFPVPDRPDQLYVITDRGPGPDYVVPGETEESEDIESKLSPIPEFAPSILTLQWNGDANVFEVVEIMPLTKRYGANVGSLPNELPLDTPDIYDMDLNVLPRDNDGLDPEGLTMDRWGNFWICEEGRPSIAMVSPCDRVLMRLVPEGTLAGDETVLTYDVLPRILATRKTNKGLEGIAITKSGRLYAAMQRPLINYVDDANKKISDTSQNLRLLEMDLRDLLFADDDDGEEPEGKQAKGGKKPLVRQYLFHAEESNKGDYISDLFALTSSILLAPERYADKLVAIKVDGATELTALEYCDEIDGRLVARLVADPTRTIEELSEAELAAFGIKPVKKAVVLDSLTDIDPDLSKCEGLCVVNGMIVLTHDNDFNLADSTAAECLEREGLPQIALQDPSNLPRISIVPLPKKIHFGK